MTTGYGRGSGFLPRPPVGKHKSTAADAADDVKRRGAVYREGLADGRACTCHPDDNPPVPCPKKYALTECRAEAWNPRASLVWRTEWHRAGYRRIVRYRDEYHPYMEALATKLLTLPDDKLRQRLWPTQ